MIHIEVSDIDEEIETARIDGVSYTLCMHVDGSLSKAQLRKFPMIKVFSDGHGYIDFLCCEECYLKQETTK